MNLIGTWQLVSAFATGELRNIDAPFGSRPSGLLTYTADGRVTAIITHGGRAPLSGDHVSSPPDERAEAFATSFAYAGRYTLAGEEVTHHVEVSTVANWVNTNLVRRIRFEGDRLVLRTPPMSVGGESQVTELIWERFKRTALPPTEQ
jgi:hypothetical protein